MKRSAAVFLARSVITEPFMLAAVRGDTPNLQSAPPVSSQNALSASSSMLSMLCSESPEFKLSSLSAAVYFPGGSRPVQDVSVFLMSLWHRSSEIAVRIEHHYGIED